MARRILLGLIVLSASVLCIQGQAPPDPTPTPYLGRSETALEKIRRHDREHARLANQTYSNLYGQGSYAKSPRYSREWRERMVTLYREPDDEETTVLEPDETYRVQYAELLQEKKTGLIKLIADLGCEGDGKVVSAAPECAEYDFPGAGASYSFRLGSYRISRLADVTVVKNSIVAGGVFNGAIFVHLGDIPIEEVGFNSPGLRFLAEYKPVKTSSQAYEAAKRFARGVKEDGFVYGRGVFVNAGSTFAMRSIAYRGKYMRSEAGVPYNELNFDRRRDVIVAFRIVDVAEDGSATIVWKVLRDIKSPKLKVEKRGK